ncbi:MAG: 3-deoxy-D-manno-octulosonate 8-phosphate phosphatase [Saprospirales bacterium]|nr:MAG: 3-deoxy-D-manno-octulosonate 8-phosphate phosphatase [Saprospirales bacterium]
MAKNLELFKRIDTVVLDVDGVLTNSQMLITESGELLRSMSVRDGYALKRGLMHGLKMCVITGGSSKGVEWRIKSLGIEDYFPAVKKKILVFDEWVNQHNVNLDNTLYMGDDLPDMDVMNKVGCPVCPADAAPEIIEIAKYVSPVKGGMGCVRDVLEKVLKLQGGWKTIQKPG